MAQHDYVIDNSTGANVRADINSVLQAIASNNSGSSAPSTTFALQFFANTTDSLLQFRNAANNAYINFRKFDGSLPIPDGSVSTPSLFFDNDSNCGLFRSAADTLNFTTGGVERMELGSTTIFNESGADVDFRIESDTETHMFFIDAANNRIGINDSTPLGKLHIISSSAGITSVNADANELVLENNGRCGITIASSTSATGVIAFADSENDDIGKIVYDHSANSMFFKTADIERIRIDSSGKIGIGTSSPANNVDINSATNTYVAIKSTDFTVGNKVTLGLSPAGGLVGTQLISEAVEDFSSGAARTAKFLLQNRLNGTFQDHLAISHNGQTEFKSQNNTGNHFRLFNSTTSNTGTMFVIDSSRNTTNATYKLAQWGSTTAARFQVFDSGNVQNTNNSYGAISDQILKENIVDASSQWDDIKNLKVRKFNFIETTDPDKKTMLGVVAQEAETVCPNLVETISTKQNGEEKEVKSFKYSILYIKAIKCLQEAMAKIETLETKVAALESA